MLMLNKTSESENNRQKRLEWNSTLSSLVNIICTMRELIDIRDGYKDCNGLYNSDLDKCILGLCIRLVYL